MKKNRTTSDLRNILLTAADKIMAGTMSPADGRNLVGVANQITQNVAVELKAQRMSLELNRPVPALGAMVLNADISKGAKETTT